MNRILAKSGLLLTLVIALSLPALAGDQLISINEATVEELTELPRVGPTVAERIVSYRDENGPFERIEEIMNVRGIGVKTFERLKDRITVGDDHKPGKGR